MTDSIQVGDGYGVLTKVDIIVHECSIGGAPMRRDRLEIKLKPYTKNLLLDLQRLKSAQVPFAMHICKQEEYQKDYRWVKGKLYQIYSKPAVLIHYLDGDVPDHIIMHLTLLE
jgi:hypothetical protein